MGVTVFVDALGPRSSATTHGEAGVAYFWILPDLGMNYTLNRPLMDGAATSRIEEVRAAAPKMIDFDSWYSTWLALAKAAEADGRWIDAATYYHQAEFYLPAGEPGADCTTSSQRTTRRAWTASRATSVWRSHTAVGTCRVPAAGRGAEPSHPGLQRRLRLVR